jgi:hypothetical protein
MPKKRTSAKGFPVDPANCYDSRHLDGSRYKIYSVMKGFAVAGRTMLHGRDSKAPLYFTAAIHKLCNAVCMSRNQVDLILKDLEKSHWIVLREEGVRRPDKSVAPNTWEVVEHAEYANAHPGQCPDYEFAPDFETAQSHGVSYGKRIRETGPVPDNFFNKLLNTPESRALGDALAALTDAERAQIIEHWKTATPVITELNLPVPKVRERGQSLKLGTVPVPKVSEPQSLTLESASPYSQGDPVPKVSEPQPLTLGKNLSTSPVTAYDTTPTTTTTPRPWLSGLWSAIDKPLLSG